ncbi:response regulator [Kamptonema sp. UHCC 0994]|uniref:hybrid sensor histidine kinase/response regulator n=1 Tax=Kamptonema sp. UHCC 0994 TaxID=3031329 RepID=UPI0023BA2A5B|nr:response regulator [Kamptonema sp. UHCC 0994]MDF0551608.1 response regulator [Kamptonema sp. UHCC 0994]
MSVDSEKRDIVLIVDDNSNNLGVLYDLLDNAGFEVWVAQDGESAIEKVGYALPDLILLDIMMPGIDGFETCKRLKENPLTADIPVVFMSALSEAVDKVKGLSLGAVDYITKPFQQEEVLARVKLHLKLYYLTKKIEKQNQELEQRVQARTAELTRTLHELKQAQVQLVQTEKMSSLGQLVAGVAHEINNPVSFIFGNLNHASEYIKDLLDHLEVYQQNYPNPVSEVSNHAEEIELDYLIEDLPNMINSMKVGAERISNISTSLRNFSRTDASTKIPVNIHEGIDSTLLILRYRLKACGHRPTIEVIKEYGELPLLKCYSGQMNQVFMNLIANAIDVLEEEESENQAANRKNPRIKISTEITNNNSVIIRIADNGAGMSDAIRAQLFEAFFTTKPAGKGTGLGLSISYQIVVEKHGGKLSCTSTLGQGTEFTVEIPIEQP